MINRFRMGVTLGVAASACLALAALAPQVKAQAISKTITIVVPYSAGGGTASPSHPPSGWTS